MPLDTIIILNHLRYVFLWWLLKILRSLFWFILMCWFSDPITLALTTYTRMPRYGSLLTLMRLSSPLPLAFSDMYFINVIWITWSCYVLSLFGGDFWIHTERGSLHKGRQNTSFHLLIMVDPGFLLMAARGSCLTGKTSFEPCDDKLLWKFMIFDLWGFFTNVYANRTKRSVYFGAIFLKLHPYFFIICISMSL